MILEKRDGITLDLEYPVAKYLTGGSEAGFIRVKARAGGPINGDLVQRLSDIGDQAMIDNAVNGDIEDTAKRAEANIKAVRRNARRIREAVYRSCIIEWETNIINGKTKKTLTPDLETWLDLWEAKGVPDIKDALESTEKAITKAGETLIEKDKEIEGN